jgi:lytic murein transglycosylase
MRGRAKAAEERAWLAKAETTYGVDRSVVMGIWGMETEFGAFEGSDYVIRALASLAFVHYSGDYFRDELIAALAILQEGDIEARDMRGSWAGAMGQTQFMPSSFTDYAVDFEGHGRRDIWNSAPDAIGSTANYLAKHGWIADAPWGFEARLPAKFKLTDADSSRFAPFASFAARGVVRADGHPLPRSGEAELLIPAGLHGPVFLVTANFKTIKSYNNSTAYALGVALLGDSIMGRGGLRARWPIRDPQLGERDVRDMQTRLRDLGYDVGEVDGRVGETLRAALRAYQESIGAPPDGYPTPALLRRMRRRG